MGFSIRRAGRIRAGSHGQRRRALCAKLLFTSVALGLFALAGWPEQAAEPVIVAAKTEPKHRQDVKPAPARFSALLDARVTIGATPLTFAEQAPLSAALMPAIADPMQTASLPSSAPMSRHPQGGEAAATYQPASLPLITSRLIAAPLPVPRPTDLRIPASADAKAVAQTEKPRLAATPATRRGKTAPVAAVAPEDNRNFIQKLFGVSPREAGTQLAYAAPQDGEIDRGAALGPGLGLRLTPRPAGPPPSSLSAGTAIYDIKAQMVYLPNGERLEAHSGFGEKMDDIRYSHVRMNGVTPPHTYNLVEREALFHGVRAIRLHPVGGSGAIFGRAGLLAHSYLLGPSGQSNGCVSIKDYDRFLQAYLRGEIRRLVVVASL